MKHQPRKREDIMLAYPYDPKRLSKYPAPWIVQPKLNGDRCRAVIEKGRISLISSTGLPRVSVPHINEALQELDLPEGFELDGELYVHGWTHQRIRSVVSRTKSLSTAHRLMEYYIFDIISDKPQEQRTYELARLLDKGPPPSIIPTPWYQCSDEDEIYTAYSGFVEDGYEGIIIRHPRAPYQRKKTTTMMKLKPRLSTWGVIIGWEEEQSIQGVSKNALGALWISLDDGTKFKVGTGFTRAQREVYWQQRQNLMKCRVKIRYQNLSEAGVPIMPSFEEIGTCPE